MLFTIHDLRGAYTASALLYDPPKSEFQSPTLSAYVQWSFYSRGVVSEETPILSKNIIIDPHGRFGPLLHHFLFGSHHPPPLTFPVSKPNATLMYSKLLHYRVQKVFSALLTIIGRPRILANFMTIHILHRPPPYLQFRNLDFALQRLLHIIYAMPHANFLTTLSILSPLMFSILPTLVSS